MDLVSSIRKQGSRGGVNFDWSQVSSSTHRENYLGHSLKAPVGRWQQGRDLTWYAKNSGDETEAERDERQRKEEIKRIKEAEEDALAKALGLPPKDRTQTGSNAVDVVKPRLGPDVKAESELIQKEEEDASGDRRALRRQEDFDNSTKRRRHMTRSRSRERPAKREEDVYDKRRAPRPHEDSEARHRRRRHRSRSPSRERRWRSDRSPPGVSRHTNYRSRDGRHGDERRRSRSPRRQHDNDDGATRDDRRAARPRVRGSGERRWDDRSRSPASQKDAGRREPRAHISRARDRRDDTRGRG